MHIYIATIGKNIVPVTKAVNALPGVDTTYLIYSEKFAAEKDEACKLLEALGIEVRCIEASGFDFNAVMNAIYKAYSETHEKGARYSINITGGTNLMAAAACITAYYIKADVYYVQNDETKSIAELVNHIPIPRVPDAETLKDKDKDILLFIFDRNRDGNDVSNVEIAREFNLDKQNAGYHVDILKKFGLVEDRVDNDQNYRGNDDGKKRDSRKNRLVITSEGKFIATWIRDYSRISNNYLNIILRFIDVNPQFIIVA